MHIFVNELSFIGQARDDSDISELMEAMMSIIRELGPVQQNDPVLTHSSFFERRISPECTIDEWARKRDGLHRDVRLFFIIRARNHPFIDEILDELLEYHECHFQNQDVSTTSIAGAAHFRGVLVSLPRSQQFDAENISVKFSIDGETYQDIDISNLTSVEHVRNIRRRYVPTPKHTPPSGWGTLMYLNDEEAQMVLDNGIPHGRQVYGFHDGTFYTFQYDNAGGYHGYPVSSLDVPTRVIRAVQDQPEN